MIAFPDDSPDTGMVVIVDSDAERKGKRRQAAALQSVAVKVVALAGLAKTD